MVKKLADPSKSTTLHVPKNKRSAWVYKKGAAIKIDNSKEHQAVWGVDGYTLFNEDPTEVWFFPDEEEVDPIVLKSNPIQGAYGYASSITDIRKARPVDMIFCPPNSKLPKNFRPKGIWLKPESELDMFHRKGGAFNFEEIGGEFDSGFHSGGTWKVLTSEDRKNKKDGKQNQGPAGRTTEDSSSHRWLIKVRNQKGDIFPIMVIPGNKIAECKERIRIKTKIPVLGQRLVFHEKPLYDNKSLLASGIQHGDTIDLADMEIFVRTPRGKKFLFEVKPDESVVNVKKMAEAEVGIPYDEQVMHFKNAVLEDGKTLADFGVQHKSNLDLESMVVYVNTLGGAKQIKMEVEASHTIDSIKYKVEAKTGISPDEQQLFHGALELVNDQASLQSYGIKNQATITMDKGVIITVVRDWEDNDIELHIRLSASVSDVQKMLADQEGIPIKQQRLSYDGDEISGEKTLAELEGDDKLTFYIQQVEITVATPGGDEISLQVSPSDTIESVKDKIEQETQIPKSNQKLTLEGVDLEDDDKTVGESKMPFGSRLKLEVPTDTGVNIEMPDGQNFSLMVGPDDTFEDIKALIAMRMETPVGDVRLMNAKQEEVDEAQIPTPGQSYTVGGPEFSIELPSKEKINVALVPQQTIDDLKNIIEEKIGMPKDRQLLFHPSEGAEALDDSLTISEANVVSGCILQVHKVRQINVKKPDDKSVILLIGPEEKVEDIKRKMSSETDIPLDDLKLGRDGQELGLDEDLIDGDNLVLSGVKDNEAQDMESMQLEIVVPNGSQQTVDIGVNDKVRKIKELIADETEVAVEAQNILNKGEILDDDKTLAECGVSHEDTLTMERSETEESRRKQFVRMTKEPNEGGEDEENSEDGVASNTSGGGTKRKPGVRMTKETNEVDDDVKLDDTEGDASEEGSKRKLGIRMTKVPNNAEEGVEDNEEIEEEDDVTGERRRNPGVRVTKVPTQVEEAEEFVEEEEGEANGNNRSRKPGVRMHKIPNEGDSSDDEEDVGGSAEPELDETGRRRKPGVRMLKEPKETGEEELEELEEDADEASDGTGERKRKPGVRMLKVPHTTSKQVDKDKEAFSELLTSDGEDNSDEEEAEEYNAAVPKEERKKKTVGRVFKERKSKESNSSDEEEADEYEDSVPKEERKRRTVGRVSKQRQSKEPTSSDEEEAEEYEDSVPEEERKRRTVGRVSKERKSKESTSSDEEEAEECEDSVPKEERKRRTVGRVSKEPSSGESTDSDVEEAEDYNDSAPQEERKRKTVGRVFKQPKAPAGSIPTEKEKDDDSLPDDYDLSTEEKKTRKSTVRVFKEPSAGKGQVRDREKFALSALLSYDPDEEDSEASDDEDSQRNEPNEVKEKDTKRKPQVRMFKSPNPEKAKLPDGNLPPPTLIEEAEEEDGPQEDAPEIAEPSPGKRRAAVRMFKSPNTVKKEKMINKEKMALSNLLGDSDSEDEEEAPTAPDDTEAQLAVTNEVEDEKVEEFTRDETMEESASEEVEPVPVEHLTTDDEVEQEAAENAHELEVDTISEGSGGEKHQAPKKQVPLVKREVRKIVYRKKPEVAKEEAEATEEAAEKNSNEPTKESSVGPVEIGEKTPKVTEEGESKPKKKHSKKKSKEGEETLKKSSHHKKKSKDDNAEKKSGHKKSKSKKSKEEDGGKKASKKKAKA